MLRIANPSFWHRKRVFLTGHTGFKGAWLAFWLQEMGAIVTGYALPPQGDLSLFNLLKIEHDLDSHHIADIRDFGVLRQALLAAKPDVVLHLAAQPIVSTGYADPIGTFGTNVMGTANLLEVCRELDGDLNVLVVSSDKCYRNDDSGVPFKVDDPLGGHDPYSASKAGTEIVVGSYAASYFKAEKGPSIASARAGNVIGGGDWSQDRLLPDGARVFSKGEPLVLRNPVATRPWQHVLEPLYGYMMLVEAMSEDRKFACAWNFGPSDRNHVSVGNVAELFASAWGGSAAVEIATDKQEWVEAAKLDLECSDTYEQLGWSPFLDISTTLSWTADWYRTVYDEPTKQVTRDITKQQISEYVRLYSTNT